MIYLRKIFSEKRARKAGKYMVFNCERLGKLDFFQEQINDINYHCSLLVTYSGCYFLSSINLGLLSEQVVAVLRF